MALDWLDLRAALGFLRQVIHAGRYRHGAEQHQLVHPRIPLGHDGLPRRDGL